MSKRLVTFATAALLAGIGSYLIVAHPSAGTLRVVPGTEAVFAESKWPFPIDEWGEGWAYQCKSADCRTDVQLYVRPKIGFCNCQTGVADDAELERVSDLDLIGSEVSALDQGRAITVQSMKGRSRSYKVGASAARSVLSLAFNNKCDVVVATVLAGDKPAAQEQAVLDFLNGALMRHWAETVLGL